MLYRNTPIALISNYIEGLRDSEHTAYREKRETNWKQFAKRKAASDWFIGVFLYSVI